MKRLMSLLSNCKSNVTNLQYFPTDCA